MDQSTARFQQWTQLTVLFSQLPANFDLRISTKSNSSTIGPTYYLDDINVVLRVIGFIRPSNAACSPWQLRLGVGRTVALERKHCP